MVGLPVFGHYAGFGGDSLARQKMLVAHFISTDAENHCGVGRIPTTSGQAVKSSGHPEQGNCRSSICACDNCWIFIQGLPLLAFDVIADSFSVCAAYFSFDIDFN